VRLCAIILFARWLVEPVNSLTIARAAKNENCIARHREETFMKKLAGACAATAKSGANLSKPPASRWRNERELLHCK
jgi:hypothetical protein